MPPPSLLWSRIRRYSILAFALRIRLCLSCHQLPPRVVCQSSILKIIQPPPFSVLAFLTFFQSDQFFFHSIQFLLSVPSFLPLVVLTSSSSISIESYLPQVRRLLDRCCHSTLISTFGILPVDLYARCNLPTSNFYPPPRQLPSHPSIDKSTILINHTCHQLTLCKYMIPYASGSCWSTEL